MKVVTSVLTMLLFGSANANAACIKDVIPWAFGSSTSATWIVIGREGCSIRNNKPQNIASIEITERPVNGTAGRAPPDGWAYRPNPGFKGEDRFTVKITSNANYRKGPGLVATVQMRVVVE